MLEGDVGRVVADKCCCVKQKDHYHLGKEGLSGVD